MPVPCPCCILLGMASEGRAVATSDWQLSQFSTRAASTHIEEYRRIARGRERETKREQKFCYQPLQQPSICPHIDFTAACSSPGPDCRICCGQLPATDMLNFEHCAAQTAVMMMQLPDVELWINAIEADKGRLCPCWCETGSVWMGRSKGG